MKKEPHITEFTAKKGSGLHVRVCTNRNGRRIAIDGGRLYYKDYGTKADTLRKARKIRDDILLEIELTPSSLPTIDNLYQRSFDLMPLSLSSRLFYDSLYDNVTFPDSPINRVTLEQLQHSVSTFALSHSQARTKRFIQMYKRIYKTAFLLQLPIIDYTAMLSMPKSKVLPIKIKTETTYQDFITFIDTAKETKHPLSEQIIQIAWIMYYTGMRTQEVLGLFESDIDLGRSIIHIRRSIGSTATKQAQIVPLKTEKSERDIPIAPALIPVLEKAIANCEKDLLFSQYGQPLDIQNISAYVNRIKRRTGITFTLYSLRHLFAADLFRQGINPKVIQSLMGHSTEDMSLYYAFTTEEEKADAVKKRTQ